MTTYKLHILDNKGVSSKSQEIFTSLKDYTPKYQVLTETIRSEMMSLRAGNAHTKTRDEVRGGGKKPWKQKGTGRARHGSIRSPIWVGGGITFGPRSNKNWWRKINKSARVTSLKTLFVDRALEDGILGFTKPAFEKTADAKVLVDSLVKSSGLKVTRMAVIYTTAELTTIRGFGNLGLKMINVASMKLSQLSNAERYILTPAALEILEARFVTPDTIDPKDFKVDKEVVFKKVAKPVAEKTTTKKTTVTKTKATPAAKAKKTTKKVTA
jgi:large subunit ribosomal protein L4